MHYNVQIMNANILRNSDEEFLENINRTLALDPYASQRKIARSCNVSLGMANAILKRFVERGWIMISNLNSTKLAYALSEEGIRTLASRSRRYVQRTFELVNNCSDTIMNRIQQAKENGKTTVVLYGQSYIKFLIEYTCEVCGMDFQTADSDGYEESETSLKLVGELCESEEITQCESMGFVNVLDLMEESYI